jgi:hypothetical protein
VAVAGLLTTLTAFAFQTSTMFGRFARQRSAGIDIPAMARMAAASTVKERRIKA